MVINTALRDGRKDVVIHFGNLIPIAFSQVMKNLYHILSNDAFNRPPPFHSVGKKHFSLKAFLLDTFLSTFYFRFSMRKPLLSKTKQKEIAEKRIRILFEQAQEMFPLNKALANRYVSLARKIAMKVKAKIPLELKRRYCKHCYRYLMPSVNARIRTRRGKVVISCLECKKFMRIPLK